MALHARTVADPAHKAKHYISFRNPAGNRHGRPSKRGCLRASGARGRSQSGRSAIALWAPPILAAKKRWAEAHLSRLPNEEILERNLGLQANLARRLETDGRFVQRVRQEAVAARGPLAVL